MDEKATEKTRIEPILVTGMHRSGTSLVIQLLEAAGLFIGHDLDDNEEARFFRGIDEWLLRTAGAEWDRPQPVADLLGNTRVRSLATRHIQRLLTSPFVVQYLGWRRTLLWRSPLRLPGPWGWKDPRMTWLLPLWLDIFPGARVVHVTRHGVDVAQSLLTRQQRQIAHSEELMLKKPARYIRWWMKRKHHRAFADTLRCGSLDEGFALWEEYLDESKRQAAQLGGRMLDLRYEELLRNPWEHVSRLVNFCGLDMQRFNRSAFAGKLNPNRAYAFRSNPELLAFARKMAERLAVRGYTGQEQDFTP